MRKPHPAWPLELRLPTGRAQFAGLVDGQPRYTMNDEPISVDVTIPPDLPGWFWWGSALCNEPDGDGMPLISVDAATYPPPGIESEREGCFDVARRIMRRRAELEAARFVKPAKKPRRHDARAREVERGPVQLGMFDEAA